VLGGAAAWPLAARAQQPEPARRIGVLMNLSESDSEVQMRIAAFRDGLKKLGWMEGRNLQVEYRWGAGDSERIRAFARELVALKLEVILAAAGSVAQVLQQETHVVPIVFAQTIDPVGSGLVASVPRPGSNITGFALFEFSIATRWVELLKEIAPNVTRVAVLYDPWNLVSPGFFPMIDAGARVHGLEVSIHAVRNDAEIEQAIEAFARSPNGGLIPLPSELIGAKRDLITSLAAKHRLPSVSAYLYYPASGGLASYGAENIDTFRRAADYIDRILRGEKPADLPVQFPTKYQLGINLKTAKALGLTIPDKLLALADEVIE
jgi:putative ABC transport system substrate-binding protein